MYQGSTGADGQGSKWYSLHRSMVQFLSRAMLAYNFYTQEKGQRVAIIECQGLPDRSQRLGLVYTGRAGIKPQNWKKRQSKEEMNKEAKVNWPRKRDSSRDLEERGKRRKELISSKSLE